MHQALSAAAERMREKDPDVVTTTIAVRRGTLADEEAVQAWVDEHKQKLTEAVAKGPVIVK